VPRIAFLSARVRCCGPDWFRVQVRVARVARCCAVASCTRCGSAHASRPDVLSLAACGHQPLSG
jgi:hypothetical protein